MTAQDLETIVAIAAHVALADGRTDERERLALHEAAARLGIADAATVVGRLVTDATPPEVLASRLSSPEARRAAYEVAAAIAGADGVRGAAESAMLEAIAAALGPDAAPAVEAARVAAAALPLGPMVLPDLSATGSPLPLTPSAPATEPPPGGSAAATGTPPVSDEWLLDQAMLAGAIELLPDRLANMAVLPLQLRMVYTIGQRHGQRLDLAQARDLAGALGIGAAAQVMEGVVRRALGGVAGGLLGGLLGGAAGNASGAAVTFAATYALGHAADRYYAQGRSLSMADLKALFARFRGEADTLYPRVEGRIRGLAAGRSVRDLVGSLGR
jgi:uncharacterized protein (DUF697 family)/tellurite resistance protein